MRIFDKECRKNYLLVENANPPLFPIGTILAWVSKLDKKGKTADLPPGWVRCNGQPISNADSIWANLRVPDLNGERRFLRGGPDSSVLNLEEDQLQNHEHTFYDPGHSHVYDYRFKSGPQEGTYGY